MKFAQLGVGQRFRYKDREYIKISPLQAEPATGGARQLLPRSAAITPLGETPRPFEVPGEIPVDQLDRVMRKLAAEINDILAQSGMSAAQTGQIARELQQAFVRARQALGLSP